MNDEIEQKLAKYPPHVRLKLIELRGLILEIGKELEVGMIDQSLKWGQPAFRAKSGTTLRFDWTEKRPEVFSLFVPCTTTIVGEFRKQFPELDYDGDRAISFLVDEALDVELITAFAGAAMTYFD